MLNKAENNILERYIKLAQLKLNNPSTQDIIKLSSELIEEDLKRAELFDKVAQYDAMGRCVAQALIAQLK
jgi:hypothetical protein